MSEASTSSELKVTARKNVLNERRMAEVTADPTVTAGYLTATFSKGIMGETDLTELVGVVHELSHKARGGDLGELEAMLVAQAMALNAMFGELARRGAANMGEHIEATERYLRLALKAQAQCRVTVETLAAIKNPPAVIAKQANIANGPQQVNNVSTTHGCAPARGGNPETVPNGLLEANGGTGERLDAGTSGETVGSDPTLATVERATGPRTFEGKAAASRNADKGGERAKLRAELVHMRELIRELDGTLR